MKLSYITVIVALCFSFQMQGQDAVKKDTAVSRELTLEKDYNPTIRDAFKMNALPEIKEPEAPKPNIEYSNFILPFEVKPQLSLLSANSYLTSLVSSKKRGYLTAGVSSFVDVDADLGYQILNNEKDLLSIFGSNRFSSGNVSYLQSDEKQKMKINDIWGGLDYLHDFGGIRLNAGMKYTYSGFNYYGSDMLNGDDWVPNPPTFDNLDKNVNQVNNMFEVGAGVINDKPNEFNYMLNLDYSLFQQKYLNSKESDGPKENRIRVEWDAHKGFNTNMSIGVGGYLKNYSYSVPNEVDFYLNKNYSNLLLNPYFGMEGDNWEMRLGVKANLVFGLSGYNNVAPDIQFTYHPSEKLMFYALAEGGVEDNGYYSMFYENRYVAPNYRVSDSKSPFDGTIGFKASLIDNLWFDIFTGYKITNNEHFFDSRFPGENIGHYSDAIITNNLIYPDYFDAKTFKLGGALKYTYQSMFDLGFKATYYNWKVSSDSEETTTDPKAWNKPSFESDLTAGFVVPSFPLRLDMIYHLEAGRKANVWGVATNMKNINELNIQGTYTINETFSIFAKANNLLFQNYDLWYGYPAQGFNVMGGISIKF